jgi:Protein of unknown function (DUF3307)
MNYLFTLEQGNFLIRLLLAHILADFVFQNRTMVQNKKWFTVPMIIHITIVFALTYILGGSIVIAAIIAFSHWLFDSIKAKFSKDNKLSEYTLFCIDQTLHILVILVLWAYKYNLFSNCKTALLLPITNYKMSLVVTGYAFVIWPLGYLIKFALDKMELLEERPNSNIETSKNSNQGDLKSTEEKNSNIKNAGKLIGQFERIIILTFVLLSQYEAIGFLITGKSIIRFAQKDENLKSEYVLVGTMMSYALSILAGLGINALIN